MHAVHHLAALVRLHIRKIVLLYVCGASQVRFNKTYSFILFYVRRDGCDETAHMQIYNIPF